MKEDMIKKGDVSSFVEGKNIVHFLDEKRYKGHFYMFFLERKKK